MSRSSTSSSEPVRLSGAPWAFLSALAIVAAVECGAHWIDPVELIPYELGQVEYQAVRLSADYLGVADVAVIGSSRAREGLVAPVLSATLKRESGRNLSVANYACAGATAEESLATLRRLLTDRQDIRLVVYGVSPRQLWGYELKYSQAALMWSWSDWWREVEVHGRDAWRYWPDVLRGQMSRYLRSLAFRARVREWTEELIQGRGPWPTPVTGALSQWQFRGPEMAMIGNRVGDARVKWYVKQLLKDGRYPFGQVKLQKMEELLRTCRQAGVPLVMVEMPLAKILHKHLPEGTYQHYLEQVRGLARRENIPFIETDRLGIDLSNREFLDQSHLNLLGATRISRALATQVLAPLLGS